MRTWVARMKRSGMRDGAVARMVRSAMRGIRSGHAPGFRRWLHPGYLLALALAFAPIAAPAAEPPVAYASPKAGTVLEFPRDHGSHPDYRTEWWYVTGWLDTPEGPLGFQVTFFRSRPGRAEKNPSAFAARQIVIAHAALSDPLKGKLLHDQRVARAGLGLAWAGAGDTDVGVGGWTLRREGNGYRAKLAAREFTLDLALAPTQPLLLQGEAGLSRKGPDSRDASHYYSLPQLAVTGTVTRNGRSVAAAGRAWLDHEWSSQYLNPEAEGWDWIGINLDDGGALMAFRMRRKGGGLVWSAATWRRPDGTVKTFAPGEVSFEPLRHWTSPRTGARYPVAFRVRAGELDLTLEPMLDDQESDSRASTGAIYWEGAVRALRNGKPAGRGYLELTGYWKAMRL